MGACLGKCWDQNAGSICHYFRRYKMKRKNQQVLSFVLAGTMGAATFSTTAVAATVPKGIAGSVGVSTVLESISEADIVEQKLDEFIKKYGKDNATEIIYKSMGVEGIPSEQGLKEELADLVLKVLKQHGDDVLNMLKKIPGIGSALSDFLGKHMGQIINFLEKFVGGIKEGISTFFQVNFGWSKANADLAASVIMVAIEAVATLLGLSIG